MTSECEKARGTAAGFRVALIDTPGIYDTKYTEQEVVRKLRECISLSAPGPHVFLIVIKLDRFTQEEQKTVELLQMVFGDRAAAYSMVLFTHGERLVNTTVEAFFSQCEKLRSLVERCDMRYHVLSNTISDSCQVAELLTKINSMVQHNGGMYYTNAMFQAAERAIQERAEEIFYLNAEKKRQEEEKLKATVEASLLQEEMQRLDEEYRRESRKKAEKKNKFVKGLIVPSAEVGMLAGAAATACAGPVCAVVGAVVGGTIGALVGLLTPIGAKAVKNMCAVQ